MDENKKQYVIDSSFVLAYLLPDENENHAQEIFDLYKKGVLDIFSTQLLRFEVANGLYAATLAKRIDAKNAKQLLKYFLQLPILIEDIDYGIAFDLADKDHISIYDASYIALAKAKNLKLLSLDKRLQKLML